MAADVKTEQLFFVGKLFVVAPRCNRVFSRRCGGVCRFIEQRNLPGGAIAMRGRGSRQRFIDAGKKFRAFAPGKIKSASLNQTFEHLLVRNACPETTAKIFQRGEIPSAVSLQ